MIYLDNAATSFPKPAGMAEAMMEHIVSWCGNPGRAGHDMSRKTAAAITDTRERLADFIGAADPSRIIFTNNATAALNLAIHGILGKGDHVITTSMEHNSVLRPIAESGAEYTVIKCGTDGSLDVSAVAAAIRPDTRMIACTHASNVTGTIMPVNRLAEVCRKYNLLLLVDASQSLGHIPVSVRAADLLAAPGHKGLLGPMGTGFLYVRAGLKLKPLMQGGTGTYSKLMEPPLEFPESFETGTLNAPGLIGLGYVLKQHNLYGFDTELVRDLDAGLRNIPRVKVYGPCDCRRKTGIVSFNIDGWDSRDIASLLNDDFGIATRAGFHCAGLAHKTIGTWDTGAVRMSIGPFNNMRQIRLAIDAVYRISALTPGRRQPVTNSGCRR